MSKKKGFTLVELLAVLIVLAVILSISVSKIMDVRYESSKKAFTNDVDELQGIAQLEYNNKKEARIYNFENGKQTNAVNEEDKLNFKGDNPGDGYIKVYPNGDIEYKLTSRDHVFCASKETGDRKGKIEKCEISDVEDFKLNLKAITTTNSIRVTVTPKSGEQDVIINEYYYQLDDGKVISSNKASHLYENLKAEENGKLKDYVIKVKACTKKGKCVEEKITVNLKQIDGIKYNLSTTDWSLEKTITFTYPEIKNVDGQSIGKNEISTDGGRTFKIYRGSITVNKDTTFVARITDGTNTKSSISVLVNKFDHTAPTITNVTGNPSNWTKNNVTLTVNGAKDKGDNNVEPGSGLANAAYSFDGGATWQASASKTYTSNTSGIVIKVRDRLGNIYTHSDISITKIDKQPPTAPTITGQINSWINHYQLIWIANKSSAVSGINRYQYCDVSVNDISKCLWRDLYNNTAGTGSGLDVAYYHSNYSDLINAFKGNTNSLNQHYQNNGRNEGRKASDSNWVRTAQNISSQGVHYIYFRAVSNAGVVGPSSNVQALYIDALAPSKPTITGQINSWINHYQLIWVSSKSSSTSGINRYQYCDISVNDVNRCSWRELYNNAAGVSSGIDVAYYHANNGDLINAFKGNTNSLNQHYIGNGRNEGRRASDSNWLRTAQNISSEGAHYIFFRAINNAGVVGSVSNVQALYIDVTPPTCVSSGGSDAWTGDSRTLVGTCSDTGGSGCKGNATWYINSKGNWTNLSPGTVYDNAGNSTACPGNQTVRICTNQTCTRSVAYTATCTKEVTSTCTKYDYAGSYNAGDSCGKFRKGVKVSVSKCGKAGFALCCKYLKSYSCTKTESYSCTKYRDEQYICCK